MAYGDDDGEVEEPDDADNPDPNADNDSDAYDDMHECSIEEAIEDGIVSDDDDD